MLVTTKLRVVPHLANTSCATVVSIDPLCFSVMCTFPFKLLFREVADTFALKCRARRFLRGGHIAGSEKKAIEGNR
jgi:hypothetical protein